MAISLNDLDLILGYNPDTHSVAGLPTVAPGQAAATSGGAYRSGGDFPTLAKAPAAVRAAAAPSMIAAANTVAPSKPVMPSMTAAPAAPAAAAAAPDINASVPMTPMGQPAAAENLAAAAMPSLTKPIAPKTRWQKIGEVAEGIGTALAPGIMAQIPGTPIQKASAERREAALEATRAETSARAAQTAESQADTWNKMHPGASDVAKDQALLNFRQQAAEGLGLQPGTFPYQQFVATGQMTMATGKTPEEQLFASKIAEGKTPDQAMAAVSAAKEGTQGPNQPLADQPNMQKILQDRYQVLNPGKPLPAQYQLPANATRGDYDRIDKALQAVEGAQGTAAQRATANALREQGMQQTKTRAEEARQQKAIDTINKEYVTPADSIERSYQMFQDAYNAILRGDAKTGAEDMLLLSQHLGTTFGQVKGSRMNKDLIQEHKDAIGMQDRIERFGNMLSTGQQLSPAQRKEFGDLIANMRNLTWQMVAHEAGRSKVPIDMLPADTRIKMSDDKGNIREIPGNQVQDYVDKGAKVAY
jgi:hypothetical protein